MKNGSKNTGVFRNEKRRNTRRRIPGPETVNALLTSAGTSPDILSHQRQVTETALKIGRLTALRFPVDLALLQAAAELHDILKPQPGHAERGADFLEEKGFPEVAALVREHTDLSEKPSLEAEILYLADKYVNGTQLKALGERASRQAEKFAFDEEALRAAMRRMERARSIEKRIERMTGVSSLLERLL